MSEPEFEKPKPPKRYLTVRELRPIVSARHKYLCASKPVEDAVVFVYEASGTFKGPEEPLVMDQVDKEFVPHLLPILIHSTVRFPNKDEIHHHLYSFSKAKSFELPLYKGEPAEPILFDKPGVVKMGCNIHDWMRGIILVLPNPYFAQTDSKGKAELELPETILEEGDIELAVFHERLRGGVDKTRQKVTLEEGAEIRWEIKLKRKRKSKRPKIKTLLTA